MNDRPTKIERRAYKWVMNMVDDPGRHAAALERWLSKSDEHRAVYKRVSIEVGGASDAAARAPVLRALARPARESAGWGAKGRMITVGGLVAAGIAAAGLFGVLHMPFDGGRAGRLGNEPALAYATDAIDRTVTLSDSSVVTLFAHSRIEANFSTTERSVRLLGGRARFAVAHNVTRPFVVYAAGGRVTATGTLFEVAIDGDVRVHLISGAVEVSFPRRARDVPEKVVRLGPGEQISYPPPAPATAASVLPTPTPQSSPAATAQQAESFDDVPASEIAAKVNASSALKIVFADPALGARKVVADFNTSDAQAVAQKLARLLGLIVDRSQPDLLILRKPD